MRLSEITASLRVDACARVRAICDGLLTGDVTDPQTREEAMMLLRAIYKRG